MNKSTVGKLLTTAFFAVFGAFMIYNNLVRPLPTAQAYAVFIGLFIIWGAVYLPLSRRGYFDWWRGKDD